MKNTFTEMKNTLEEITVDQMKQKTDSVIWKTRQQKNSQLQQQKGKRILKMRIV